MTEQEKKGLIEIIEANLPHNTVSSPFLITA